MSKTPARAVFAIPGDLAAPTGGYAYDRRVLALLHDHGVVARHVALPGSFPRPTANDLATTRTLLLARAPNEVLLVDGLAWGALPRDLAASLGPGIVALCHHPLGLETGLAPEESAALIATERATLSVADHIVVSSAMTAATLLRDFGASADKITVAEPGVDRAPPARGSGGGPLEILAVGSVVPRKGYDVLAQALATLTDLDWRLRIAGALDRASAYAQGLRAQIEAAGLEDRITLAGAVDDDTLAAMYDRADLFVSASHYEGYGMVLTEALVRGLPLVASTGGAAAETVPDAAALKIPPGDAPALAQALRRAISDSALRATLARGATQAADRLPTWTDAAARVAGALRMVAERMPS